MSIRIYTSWDDGNKLDIRMAQLLKQYDLPGIFFIPNSEAHCDITLEEIRYLVSEGFEIGGHTKTHYPDMKRLSIEKQTEEIVFNKGWLEGLIGRKLEWFCYPHGRYDDNTVRIVKDAGYKYARTTVVDTIYNVKSYDELGSDRFRIRTAAHVYQSKKYGKLDWLERAKFLFLKAKETDAIYHIFGHSWEVNSIGEFGLWKELEELFKFINDNKNV